MLDDVVAEDEGPVGALPCQINSLLIRPRFRRHPRKCEGEGCPRLL